MNKVIISVFGPDRPGILATVSRILFEQACNIENVSQTILQSEFAGIFIAEMPGELPADHLHQTLQAALIPMRLHANLQFLTEAPAAPFPPSEPFVITTIGPDRKGLVAGITGVLAAHGVNITHLQAVFKGGSDPHGNIMIFEVDIPLTLDPSALRAELQQKATDLDLSISIQHRDIFQAIHRL